MAMDMIVILIMVLIGAALAVSLIFKLAKKIATWALFLIVIIVVAATIFGINIVSEISDLSENLPKAQNMVLLKDDNQLLTGFAGKLLSADVALSYITKDQLAVFQNYYRQENLNRIKSDSFKVIIIDISAFNESDMLDLGGEKVPTQEILGHIKDSDTYNSVLSSLIKKQGLPDTLQLRNVLKNNFKQANVSTDADLRAFLFVQLLSASMKKNQFFLIKGFKSGSIFIYPETLTFKVAKMVPEGTLNALAERVTNDGNPG